MRVSDIMTEAAVTDAAHDSLAEGAARMWNAQTGSLLIVEGDHLAGIVTERDILRAVAQGLDLKTTPLKDIMVTDLLTIQPTTTLREAARIMASRWVRHLPVLENGKLMGVLSQRDLTGVLAEALNEPEAMHNLVESSNLVRERRLRRVEAGDFD